VSAILNPSGFYSGDPFMQGRHSSPRIGRCQTDGAGSMASLCAEVRPCRQGRPPGALSNRKRRGSFCRAALFEVRL